jgi:predicted DNA-binding protein
VVLVTYKHYVVYTAAVKQRTNIYLRPDQMKKLKALNEKTGAPVAELVRRAVDEYLKKRAKEK